MAYVERSYGWNVAVVNLVDPSSTPTYHYGPIYTDCELSLTYETDAAKAVTDRNTRSGVAAATHKARSWEVRLGALLAPNAAADSGDRKFGWELSVLEVGSGPLNLLPLFKVARINISAELDEARAVKDAVTVFDGAGTGAGWKYPAVKGRDITIDLDLAMAGAPAAFEHAIANYQTGFNFTITGTGIGTINGTAKYAGNKLTEGDSASQETAQLVCTILPTITPVAGMENLLLKRALTILPHGFVMTRHGAGTYEGSALVTEASFEAPDGAITQGATLMGYGSLRIVTP